MPKWKFESHHIIGGIALILLCSTGLAWHLIDSSSKSKINKQITPTDMNPVYYHRMGWILRIPLTAHAIAAFRKRISHCNRIRKLCVRPPSSRPSLMCWNESRRFNLDFLPNPKTNIYRNAMSSFIFCDKDEFPPMAISNQLRNRQSTDGSRWWKQCEGSQTCFLRSFMCVQLSSWPWQQLLQNDSDGRNNAYCELWLVGRRFQ